MESNTWIIFFIILMGQSLTGVYIYFKKKLRKKVNMTEVWKLFIIINILRFFDVLSTIYFTSKLGIEYEGNFMARTLMMQFGIVPGITIAALLTIPIAFFCFILVNYFLGKIKNGIGWKIFKTLIITISIIIPIMNVSS